MLCLVFIILITVLSSLLDLMSGLVFIISPFLDLISGLLFSVCLSSYLDLTSGLSSSRLTFKLVPMLQLDDDTNILLL